jgi:hypothetical protein
MEARPCMARAVAVSGVIYVNKMDPRVQLQRFFNPRHYIFGLYVQNNDVMGKRARALFYDIVYRSDFITIESKSYFDNSDSTTSSNQDSA